MIPVEVRLLVAVLVRRLLSRPVELLAVLRRLDDLDGEAESGRRDDRSRPKLVTCRDWRDIVSRGNWKGEDEAD